MHTPEAVRRLVFADFSISHVMKFHADNASGSITLCPFMLHPSGCPDHRLCKRNVLAHLPAVAVHSVAFRPKLDEVGESAGRVAMRDLQEVLTGIP